jgi:hypothetical protein
MKIIAIIPYFGGDHSAAHSEKKNRPEYLRKTVASLKGFANPIIVGVTCKEDASVVPEGATTVWLSPDETPHIPLELVRFGQGLHNYDLMYYTEADQVLHYDPFVLRHAHGKQYLSPHRLEQLVPGRDSKGTGGAGKDYVDFISNKYVLANGSPPKNGDQLYKPNDGIDAFGGAWLASRDLFNTVDFPSGQIEDVSGFHLNNVAECRKPVVWQRFFVEHLSGLDHTRREAGIT